MQSLYYRELDNSMTATQIKNIFDQHLLHLYQVYLFHLLVIRDICNYALTDANRRAMKFIQTQQDKAVNIKITKNPLILFLNSSIFKSIIEKEQVHIPDQDLEVKLLFQKFKEWSQYQNYINSEIAYKSEMLFMINLYNDFLLKNEFFIQIVEDAYPNYSDDDDITIANINITIKNLQFYEKKYFHIPEIKYIEATAMCYPIIEHTINHNEEFATIIAEYTQNWEIERLAILDQLCIKMAMCELLYMPEIPGNDSINEYIDLAKMYSTPKSGEFVNGILDKIKNKLKEANKIIKTGAGLKE